LLLIVAPPKVIVADNGVVSEGRMTVAQSTAISPSSHASSAGHFSQGVEIDPSAHRLLFISGQLATDSEGQVVGAGDIRAQARAVFANLASVLSTAGGDLSDVVGMTVFLTARADFDGFNEVRNEILRTEPYPSSTLVVVAGLVLPEHLVEVNAVAALTRR
jgi:enamine deaminase RidA (YjgF/YER057c/UK114 family)